MDKTRGDMDDALVQATTNGDETSASRLYHRYAPEVYRLIYRIVLDEHQALDVAQECWTKVFRKLHRFRRGTSFQAWVFTIASRCAIDEVRRNKRNHLLTDFDENESAVSNPSSFKALEDQEVMKQIEHALRQLPIKQRAAFIMRHYEGCSLKEIADVLGCFEGTVKTHIHRAVKTIRITLNHWNKTDEKS